MGETPRGHVLIRVLDGRDDLIDADAQPGERMGLDLHQDLARNAAIDVDAGDAGLVLERFDDGLIRERRELPQIGRRRLHRDRRDRLVVLVLDAGDQRVLDVARETRTHDRDLVADVLNRLHDVRRQAELDENLARTFARIRENPLDAGDLIHRVFERLRYIGLDRFGRRAGIQRHDLDKRKADVRHLLDTKSRVRKDAEDGNPDHHHRCEDGVFDRDARDQHGRCPFSICCGLRQPLRSGLLVVAFCDDVGTRTSAGAPSFRLSNRADKIGRSGGSVVLISTSP